MSEINVTNLTFCYEGSYDNIFENVSFHIDTSWKLGFIGRNGKGKSTFLNLLLGKYAYQGKITSSEPFDYFPYEIPINKMSENTISIIEWIYPDYELWKICRELDLLNVDASVLYRPYSTLSHGERTKVMLSVLFSRDQFFLLIDEPTNHLDMETRELLSHYLSSKKGFILVSHDRSFLDSCIDHVLVLNRNSIVVEKGNFSSWWENKQRKDQFEKATNERLKKDILKLEESARQSAAWADKIEQTKIGFNPLKEHDRFLDTRAYIAEKSRRMQQRRKNLENRQQNAIEEKKELLKDLEISAELKLFPLVFHKELFVSFVNCLLGYQNDKNICSDLSFEMKQGERILLKGRNGCGKSSIIKAILQHKNVRLLNNLPIKYLPENLKLSGDLSVSSGLVISYISQDTSYLCGTLDKYIEQNHLDNTLMKSILRQLDFERNQFTKNMECFSEGQKKKVLIATSLASRANLYIWDEPLNYIDVFSRMQIEKLILDSKPTMLFVEHDKLFGDKIATKTICL